MAKIIVEDPIEPALTKIIQNTAEESISRDDIFKIGLSGGSMVKLLTSALPNVTTDWSKWRFFFCDERIVPFDNTESTYGLFKNSLIGTLPITEDQFIKINTDLSADEAAKDYIKKMSVYFPPDCLPRFDLLLLGLGPDGHTCSLFPGHKLLDESSLWVCPINDSPKPPLSRITLTLPVVNNARVCMFAVTGSGKAKIVQKIMEQREKLSISDQLPAARIQPTNGTLYWILDRDAGKFIH
ncbi:6-phosphogluconolactonase [Prorops nasuta]|uniref:6-phosphogluconolactonase n=1 Tax=Prorops nasuta TaxID=863751 RepID=UPI0034CD346A